jgi:protein-disulfide isomerase
MDGGRMGKSQRKSRIQKRRAAENRNRILRFSVVVIVGAAATAAFLLTRPPDGPPVSAERSALNHSLGAETAPVTIIEYGDYNCPSCTQYHQLGIIEQLLARFPEDVRFIYRHFAVITPTSPHLGEAAECAHDQGVFWEFHDILFANSPSNRGDVLQYANHLGLDQSKFETCIESRQYAALVQSQIREAHGFGLRGTPSFVINDIPLAGPPSFDQLAGIVEALLAQNQ